MAPSAFKMAVYKYQAVDWTILILLSIALFVMDMLVDPHCRSFDWHDATINYPMRPDSFPNYSLGLMGLLVPVFYALFTLFCVSPLRRVLGEPLSVFSPYDGSTSGTRAAGSSGGEADCTPLVASRGGLTSRSADVQRTNPLNEPVATREMRPPSGAWSPSRVRSFNCEKGPVYAWFKAHVWSFGLAFSVMNALKLYTGRLRPDYLARLAVHGFTADVPGLPNPHTDPQFYCDLMAKYPSLREGRLSFPSGHSSISFSIFTITALFFMAHLRPFARQGSLTRLLLGLTPLLVPAFCAISRTRDNKHHFADILSGSLIGIASALLVWGVTFRRTGGPLAVYLARTASDIEYVRARQCECRAGDGGGLGGGAADRAPTTDYMAISGPRVVSPAGKGGSGEESSTVEIPIASSPSRQARDVKEGPPAWAGAVVSEKELNEDPAAVPWL